MLTLLSYIIFQFCDGPVKESSLPEPPQGFHTDHRVPLVLWPGVDQEETKKQVCPLEPSPYCFIFISGLRGVEPRGCCQLKSSLNVWSIFLCLSLSVLLVYQVLGKPTRFFLRSIMTTSATVTSSSCKIWGLNDTGGLEEKLFAWQNRGVAFCGCRIGEKLPKMPRKNKPHFILVGNSAGNMKLSPISAPNRPDAGCLHVASVAHAHPGGAER